MNCRIWSNQCYCVWKRNTQSLCIECQEQKDEISLWSSYTSKRVSNTSWTFCLDIFHFYFVNLHFSLKMHSSKTTTTTTLGNSSHHQCCASNEPPIHQNRVSNAAKSLALHLTSAFGNLILNLSPLLKARNLHQCHETGLPVGVRVERVERDEVCNDDIHQHPPDFSDNETSWVRHQPISRLTRDLVGVALSDEYANLTNHTSRELRCTNNVLNCYDKIISLLCQKRTTIHIIRDLYRYSENLNPGLNSRDKNWDNVFSM